jgi:hypothetical protein
MAVDLKECINAIEQDNWLALRLITADVKKGTGGKVIEIRKFALPANIMQVQFTTPLQALGRVTLLRSIARRFITNSKGQFAIME